MADEKKVVQLSFDVELGISVMALKSAADKDLLPKMKEGSIAFVPATGEYFIMFDIWEGPF